MGAGDDTGEGPTMATNIHNEVHCELDRQCSSGDHRHKQLIGRKARGAAIDLKTSCKAVCQGVAREMEIDAADLISPKCQVASSRHDCY